MSKKRTNKASAAPTKKKSIIDFSELEQLAEFMEKHRLVEVEWQSDQFSVHMKTAMAGATLAPQVVHQAPTVSAAPRKEEAKPSGGLSSNQKQITCPFV